jgi:hypothetical protein
VVIEADAQNIVHVCTVSCALPLIYLNLQQDFFVGPLALDFPVTSPILRERRGQEDSGNLALTSAVAFVRASGTEWCLRSGMETAYNRRVSVAFASGPVFLFFALAWRLHKPRAREADDAPAPWFVKF